MFHTNEIKLSHGVCNKSRGYNNIVGYGQVCFGPNPKIGLSFRVNLPTEGCVRFSPDFTMIIEETVLTFVRLSSKDVVLIANGFKFFLGHGSL